MKTKPIYAKDWLQIHPYTAIQPSDTYFIELSNRLFKTCALPELPEAFRKKLALYASAYLEDQLSGLGLLAEVGACASLSVSVCDSSI